MDLRLRNNEVAGPFSAKPLGLRLFALPRDRCLQIALATRARHFSNQPKIFLSSNIHSFSTGCYSLSLDYWSHWSFESLWSYKSLYAKPEESLDKAQMRAVSAGGATVRTQREYNEYVAAILIPASDILKGAKQAPEAKGETEKPADTAAPKPAATNAIPVSPP